MGAVRLARFEKPLLTICLVLMFASLQNVRAQGRAAGGNAPVANAPAPAYPVRAPGDPSVVERGKTIFSVNCSFCHGNDARGGETGPSLVRSQIVLDDKNGELIGQVMKEGRPLQGMPKFDLSQDDVLAIATFIHSLPTGSRPNLGGVVNQLVGDAKAGEAFFNGAGKCTACHSATGDFAHIGTKYQVMPLQGAMMAGGRGRGGSGSGSKPVTATITLPSGEVVNGTLDRIDDFDVSVVDSAGVYRDFSRNGNVPKVEVHDPLAAHLALLRTINDSQMHDLTAYLVTLK